MNSFPINLNQVLQNKEVTLLKAALRETKGSQAEAARLLTINRTTLIEKLRRYRLLKWARTSFPKRCLRDL